MVGKPKGSIHEEVEMPAVAASVSWPAVLAALIGGGIFAATVGLWAYYGTTVFFEIVRTGWAACF